MLDFSQIVQVTKVKEYNKNLVVLFVCCGLYVVGYGVCVFADSRVV